MAKPRAVTIEVYTAEDVMTMLDCSRSYAYGIIKKLRKELADMGYMNVVPSGRIQKSYFDSRVFVQEAAICSK